MNTPVIFFAFANDDDAHLKLLKEESKRVNAALQDVHKKEYVRLEREESADVDDLFNMAANYGEQMAVFHYAGHAAGTHLRLEGGDGGAEGLAGMLGSLKDLKLVFLNGCSTKGQVETMMDAGVKAVIATSVPIQDKKAMEFSEQFYMALANRRTIQHAFQLAQNYLKTKYKDKIEIDIEYRDVKRVTAPPNDPIPWGLYVKEEHKDEILNYRLPHYREVGLPKDMLTHIGTGYKEVPTNKAIVLVLDEMTKYNPDIYAQMVEKKGDKEIPKDSNTFPGIIIENFPWPIGSQIRLLQVNDGLNLERLNNLVSTYVLTSQVLYYIMLSNLWEDKRGGRIKLPKNFKTGLPLDAAGFGKFDFLAKTVELYQIYADNGIPPYVDEFAKLAETWSDENSNLRKAHGKILEPLRDQLANDPGSINMDTLEKQCLTTEKAVSFVLREAAFLARYRMLTVRNIMLQAPRFREIEYELDMGRLNAQGDTALKLYNDDQWRLKDNHTNSLSIVLSQDEDQIDDCLNLSPFIIDKNTFAQVKKHETTENDKLAHIFMMAYEEAKDRLLYLSVNHSLDVALQNEGDKINTGMTLNDFLEGRNLTDEQADDDDDLFDDDLEDQATAVDTSPQVFTLLQQQYEDFKADMLT